MRVSESKGEKHVKFKNTLTDRDTQVFSQQEFEVCILFLVVAETKRSH